MYEIFTELWVDNKLNTLSAYLSSIVYTCKHTLDNAILDFKSSEQSSEGYALDFGVLENGETALVEWNNGFAIGAYGLRPEVYCNMLIARWEEILNPEV